MKIVIGLMVALFLIASSLEARLGKIILREPLREIVKYQMGMGGTLSIREILKRWTVYRDATRLYRMLPDQIGEREFVTMRSTWKGLELETRFGRKGKEIFLKEVIYRDRDFEIKEFYDSAKIITVGGKIIYDGLIRVETRRRKQ